jgi:HSP20 family protein
MTIMEHQREVPSDLQSFIDRMFDEFPFVSEFPARLSQLALPALDLYEKDGRYMLDVAVPGYEPKDVNIEVNGNAVTISGTHTESDEKKGARFHRREIRSGSFRRTVSLPQDIDPDKVDATISKGVLTLALSPTKPIAAKKIAIKSM